MIIQGSNVYIALKFDRDMTNVQDLKISLYQCEYNLLKTWLKNDLTITGDTVKAPLTQTETIALPRGTVYVEAKWLDSNGITRFGSIQKETVLSRADHRLLVGTITGGSDELETLSVETLNPGGGGTSGGITEEECLTIVQTFFNSHKSELKGDPGTPGAPGAKGDPFTYNDFTPDQLASLKGEPGKDGDPGYTPVKGVDYFTTADKTEIVNSILSQIVNAEEVAY